MTAIDDDGAILAGVQRVHFSLAQGAGGLHGSGRPALAVDPGESRRIMLDPQTEAPVPPEDVYKPSAGSSTEQSYPPQPYPPNGYVQRPYPPRPGIVPADQGLSDTAAGALAYVTIVPAIVFLLLAPYNTRPFVKFHAFQCLGLAVVGVCLSIFNIIPILGQIVFLFGWLVMLVLWVLSLVKASQGRYMRLPVLSDFASRQSGFPIR